jgi:hypothetical protein
MERMGSIIMPMILVMAFIFMVTFVYGIVNNKDYYDDDTVTITFNCSQVLSAEEQYPQFVVAQCRKIKNTK